MSEHAAVLDLVPVAQATHVAGASGDWSSASTWSGGAVPGAAARVLVPDGVAVTYDVDGTAALQWLRVDGELAFRTDVDTHLQLDTLVVTGRLEVGTQQAPVAPDVSARISFVDVLPLDTAADPMRLGRGLIAMGPVRMWGSARLPRFLPLAEDALAGDAVIDLDGLPAGWRQDDEVVVVGTRYLGVLYTFPMTASDDEVRAISAIDGSQLTLDAPLSHDHEGVPGQPWARPHVANLGCNVTLASAMGAATPIAERGHVMMMDQDVLIENVCFEHLGRTDKSVPVDDPMQNLDGSPGTGANPRGRYSLHFHRMGTDHQANWMQRPATVRGCVVRDNPGWGVAVHQSHGVVEDCVSFQVFGAHFVTEDGNEQGAFRRNIAIHAPGDIANRGYKDGIGNHDLAHSGCGFWIQGRDFGVEDNVAAGMGDAGFCWFHRSLVFNASNPMAVQVENVSHPMRPYLHLRRPIIVDGIDHGDFTYNDIPIAQVRNNLSYASGTGHRITKANPVQLGDQFSVLTDLHSFNVDEGLFHEYTRHYVYDGLRAWGNQPDNPFRVGITSFALADHLTFRDPVVSGFGSCLRTNQFFEGQFDHPNVLLGAAQFSDCLTEWENFAPANPRGSVQLSLASLPTPGSTPAFVPAADQDYTLAANPAIFGNDFVLRGHVVDQAAAWPLELLWPGPFLAQRIANEGYHTDGEGDRVLRLQTRVHSRIDPSRWTDHVFVVRLPEVYANALGPNLGPLPPHEANVAPTAADRSFEVASDSSYRIDVPAAAGLLSGAADPEADSLQVALAELGTPSYGVLSVAPNGGFMYRRIELGHQLPDQFTYRLHDTWSTSNEATVVIHVADSAAIFRDGFEPAQVP